MDTEMNAECLGKFLGILILEDLASKIAFFSYYFRKDSSGVLWEQRWGSVHGETRIFKCTTGKLGDFSQLAVDGHQIGGFEGTNFLKKQLRKAIQAYLMTAFLEDCMVNMGPFDVLKQQTAAGVQNNFWFYIS